MKLLQRHFFALKMETVLELEFFSINIPKSVIQNHIYTDRKICSIRCSHFDGLTRIDCHGIIFTTRWDRREKDQLDSKSIKKNMNKLLMASL